MSQNQTLIQQTFQLKTCKTQLVYSLILGFIFSASTIWNTNFMFLQSYSWIIGAFVAAFVYYLLARE